MLDRLVGGCTLVGIALLVPGMFGLDYWILELFIHWELWVAGALVLPLMWFALRRRPLAFGLALLGVARGIMVAWPYVGAEPALARGQTDPKRELVVVTVNLNQDHADDEALIDWMFERKVDVASIQEITPENAPHIGKLLAPHLPHHVFVPARDAFGMGLASRWPLEAVEKFGADVRCPVQFAVTIDAPGGKIRYFNVHSPPPVERARSDMQRTTLDRIARRVLATDLPVVVAGDFNLTPWSPTFRGFLKAANLRDPRIGRGLLPTWSPSTSAWPLIPIDHILATEAWRVGVLELGPDFGSDHRPLIARLAR